jgi:hypothetical protein
VQPLRAVLTTAGDLVEIALQIRRELVTENATQLGTSALPRLVT